MMSHRHALKQRFLNKQPVFGSWIASGSPVITELVAMTLKPHFLVIDLEHTTISWDAARELFLCAQSQGVCAFCVSFFRSLRVV